MNILFISEVFVLKCVLIIFMNVSGLNYYNDYFSDY